MTGEKVDTTFVLLTIPLRYVVLLEKVSTQKQFNDQERKEEECHERSSQLGKSVTISAFNCHFYDLRSSLILSSSGL